MPNPSQFDEQLVKNVGSVPDHSWDVFFYGFWWKFGSKLGSKIDIKGGWKNYEKMMMARMALRSHMGECGWDRNADFRAWGGGKEGGKPFLQGKLEEMELNER